MFKKLKELKKELNNHEKNFGKGIVGIVIGLLLVGLGIKMPDIFVKILPETLRIPETALIAVLTTVFGGLTSIYGIVLSIISKIKAKKINMELDDEILDIEYQVSELKRKHNIEKNKINSYQNINNNAKVVENAISFDGKNIQNEEKVYVKTRTR